MILLDPKLQAFVAVVETGTVHAAAQRLNITQTAATQRIKSLERLLSNTLFIRSRKGMKLNQEGFTLLRYCQNALDSEGIILSEISGAQNKSNVNVTLAGPTSIMGSRIIPNCLNLYKEFPNLILNYRLDDKDNRVELLKRGEVQLAILPPEQVTLEMDSKILKPDRYVLVASSKWKNRKLRDIVKSERIIDFYDNDETTKKYLKKYDLLNISKPDRIFANTNYAIVSLVKSGIGYGTLTTEVAATDVAGGDIFILNQREVMEEAQALAWHPRKEMPKYFQRIIDYIK